jgi:hypothetical protein
MKFRTATVVLVATGITLASTGPAQAGSGSAHKAKAKSASSEKVLRRAFARSTGDTAILHLRTRTTSGGSGTFTDDVWMHVGDEGFVDAVRELRLDGAYAGDESVFSQPHGLGDLRDVVGRTRDNASAPIRTVDGVGYGDSSIGGVIDASLKAARGELDLSRARRVSYDGRDAYEIRLRDATGEPGHRSPAQISVTLWVDRQTNAPIAVRWGEGSELWRTAQLQAFEQLPDDAAHQPLLNFG